MTVFAFNAVDFPNGDNHFVFTQLSGYSLMNCLSFWR